MHEGGGGGGEKMAAVQDGNDFPARRQNAVIKLVDFLVNGVESGLLFGSFAHQHDALDYIRLVDDSIVFHMVRSSHVAQPNFWALDYVRDVLNPKSVAGLCF